MQPWTVTSPYKCRVGIKNKSEKSETEITDIVEKHDVIKRFLKSYSIGDLDEAIEHFKSMQDYAKLCNKVYLNTMLTGETIEFDIEKHGIITSIVADVFNDIDNRILVEVGYSSKII